MLDNGQHFYHRTIIISFLILINKQLLLLIVKFAYVFKIGYSVLTLQSALKPPKNLQNHQISIKIERITLIYRHIRISDILFLTT